MLLALAVVINNQRVSDDSADVGVAIRQTLEPSQSPTLVKGADRGENGNDHDSLFDALTISPTDPDTLYVGSEGNGIFKSTDAGRSWEWLRDGLILSGDIYPELYDMAVDLEDPTRIYAATTNGPEPISGRNGDGNPTAGVFISTNSGDSWAQFNEGLLSVAVLSIEPIPEESGSLVLSLDGQEPSYTGGKDIKISGGLYKSTDSGQSWFSLHAPGENDGNRFKKVIVAGSNSQYIYSSGQNWVQRDNSYTVDPELSVGLIRSQDGGETWDRINPKGVVALYFDVSKDGQIIYAQDLDKFANYISYDAGNSWIRRNTRVNGPIKILSDNGMRVLEAGGNVLYLSEDGLKTSKLVLSNIQESIQDIEIAPSNEKIIYLGTTGLNIYKSSDGGLSFELVADLRDFIEGSS